MNNKFSNSQPLTLSPVQQEALVQLRARLEVAPVLGFVTHTGAGASTVLRQLVADTGGRLIGVEDMLRVNRGKPAPQFDDLICAEIKAALEKHPVVVVDDLEHLMQTSGASSRPGWLTMIFKDLAMVAVATGHRLVMSGSVLENWQTGADKFGSAASLVAMRAYGVEDYAVIARNTVGADKLSQVDFQLLHGYASHLSAYQLRLAFKMVANTTPITTDAVIDCLATCVTSSNTRVEEVEPVRFEQLPGHEEIIEELQTHIVLPMENRELSQSLGLRPKRGVLLFGPPGTGKTSIGRALAHHMKGKFFLIDGSFVTEPPPAFFGKIESVIEEAKKNAPSVLFIDDADTLFGIAHIGGLSRYLLTLLDGLESHSASDVCVMMTAMNVRDVPEALLRSGRVELWLETRAPDAAVRTRILQRWLGTELPKVKQIDLAAVAEMTDGFTPADIRRVVDDSKTLYAADVVAERRQADAFEYVKRSVAALIAVRSRMAECLNDDRLRLSGSAFSSGDLQASVTQGHNQ